MHHMARTTINLDNTLFKRLKTMAERDNRSTPNMIETILHRYLEEVQFVDALEMAEFHKDPQLQKDITRSWSDYKKGRYEIV